MSITRRSHYLPQFYLRYFTENNSFFEYDIKNGKITKKSPYGSAWEPFYYAFRDIHGMKNISIEDKILSLNENKASGAINKIVDGIPLSDQDLVEFMIFMSILKFRVPKFREYIIKKKLEEYKKDFFKEFQNEGNKEKFIKKFNKSRGHDSGITVNNFMEKVYISDEEFEKNLFYYALIINGFNHIKDFIKMDWYFIKIETDTYFITSDDPIVGAEANKYNLLILKVFGIDNTKDLIIFSITKEICLILNKNNNNKTPNIKGYYKINGKRIILEINNLIFKNCYRLIFGNSEKIINEVIRSKG